MGHARRGLLRPAVKTVSRRSGELARRAVRTSAATAGDGERRRSPSTPTDPPVLASSHVRSAFPCRPSKRGRNRRRLIQARRATSSWTFTFGDRCQPTTFVRSVSDGVQAPFGVQRAWPAPPPAAQTRPAPFRAVPRRGTRPRRLGGHHAAGSRAPGRSCHHPALQRPLGQVTFAEGWIWRRWQGV